MANAARRRTVWPLACCGAGVTRVGPQGATHSAPHGAAEGAAGLDLGLRDLLRGAVDTASYCSLASNQEL
jgi:hypothetical protein